MKIYPYERKYEDRRKYEDVGENMRMLVKMRISENMRMFMNMRIRVISSLQSMKPFWTMSQMSTLDGSPKLERQVEKLPKV